VSSYRLIAEVDVSTKLLNGRRNRETAPSRALRSLFTPTGYVQQQHKKARHGRPLESKMPDYRRAEPLPSRLRASQDWGRYYL